MDQHDSDLQITALVRRILAEDEKRVSRTYGKDGTVIKTSQQWLVEPGHIMRVDHFDLDGKAPVFTHIRFGSEKTSYDLLSDLYASYEADLSLNNIYINDVDLPDGFRTASSGLILPESVFPNQPMQLPRDWRQLGRLVAAKSILGLGYGTMVLTFLAFIFSLVVWQDEIFKPILGYLLRPSNTPLTHGDLITVVIVAAVVFGLIWAFRLLGPMIEIWIREVHLLSWRVEDPLRCTPEVISKVRASWWKDRSAR